MGSFADELAADLAEAVGGYEQMFVWQERSYFGVRTTAPAALLAGPGGDTEDVSERITVALAEFSDPGNVPAAGDLVDGYALQIYKVDQNVGHLVLWCGRPMNMMGGD